MKWVVYNLLFAAVYPFLLPGFLVRMIRRGGYAARMGDRFALYPASLLARLSPLASHRYTPSDYVWIHAVSVGEVQVAGQLMREWREAEPTVKFCFSTTSSTGWKMAGKEIREDCGDVLIYNPLDFPNFVKSSLKTFRPRAIVLTESEIWPNFILTAKRYRIPTFLINARVSDRSAPRYKLARFFFGDVLSAFTKIFAQSDLDKARLVAAGAPADKVEVTGSFKFDVAHRNEAKERELAEWIGVEDGKRQPRMLLGGSTWPGEDKVLLAIYRSLLDLELEPRPLLVLAPRHFEKADAVEANISAAGFSCIRRSREIANPAGTRSRTTGPSNDTPAVFLADTTGELMGLYGIADAVFVGKSLCAHGSQNMIEPCLCGKPTVVGPYTENFRPVMSDLLSSDAIVQVKDEAELKKCILGFFREPTDLGSRAKAAVEKRRGVVRRCVAAIMLALAGCFNEVKPEKPPMNEAVSNSIETIAAVFSPTGDVLRLDVAGLTVAQFYELIKHVSPRATLWMPGATDWVIAGAKDGGFISLSASIDRLFSLDTSLSLPELFAGYVGTMEEVLPAFGGLDWKSLLIPENFIPEKIPELIWLKTDGLDDDIRRKTLAEIRSMQVVRRLVLEGNMHAVQAGDKQQEEKAIDCWARAAKRNPHDPMLLERIERLNRNARGFLDVGKVPQAMKCYETVFLIQPENSAAIHNFGMCLKKIGRLDLAEKVLERAKNLENSRNQSEEVRK